MNPSRPALRPRRGHRREAGGGHGDSSVDLLGVWRLVQGGGVDPTVCTKLCPPAPILLHADTNEAGVCVTRDAVTYLNLWTVDSTALAEPLCVVPSVCMELGNTTALIQAATGVPGWAQHPNYKYRVCTAAEPISDACDPGPEQVRSNTISFLVVFIAQILALLLSKVILAWKLRKMVDENDVERRRGLLGVLDANTLLRVEAFTQAEETRALAGQQQKMRDGTGLTPKQRRRGIRALIFMQRLRAAAKEKHSVDKVMLEVAEAVAAHWLDVRAYYCAVVMGSLLTVFFYLGFISAAKSLLQ